MHHPALPPSPTLLPRKIPQGINLLRQVALRAIGTALAPLGREETAGGGVEREGRGGEVWEGDGVGEGLVREEDGGGSGREEGGGGDGEGDGGGPGAEGGGGGVEGSGGVGGVEAAKEGGEDGAGDGFLAV